MVKNPRKALLKTMPVFMDQLFPGDTGAGAGQNMALAPLCSLYLRLKMNGGFTVIILNIGTYMSEQTV